MDCPGKVQFRLQGGQGQPRKPAKERYEPAYPPSTPSSLARAHPLGLLSLTDGKNQTTRWNYDEYGRVTNKLDQAGVEILRYRYDPDGRLTNRWSAAMGSTAYTFDPVGNLTFINYPSSSDVALQYDWLNRLTNMVDAVGTTKYTYTAGNQLWTEDGPFASDTVTNTYVNRLRTALALQQPSGLWTNAFAYDAARHLTNVTSPAGAFGYDYTVGTRSTASLISKLTLPNGSAITNNFDSVGRLLATHLRTSAGALTNKHEYLYNPAGQRTNQTFIDASSVAYRYDNIGQLKVADSSVATEDRGYAYDAAWNLNYRTNSGVADIFSVDGKNQLTNAYLFSGAGNHDGTFDANGNLVTMNIDSSAFINSYFYDDENRLIYFTHSASGSALQWSDPPQNVNDRISEFHYDGQGRLRQRLEYVPDYYGYNWELSETVNYIYDGWRVIQQRDANNTPTVSYTRGNDLSGSLEGAGGIGGLLARSGGYSGGNWTSHAYYHADGNGNVTLMLDGSQTMVASYRYDPFGNTISSSGTLADANVYRFSSKETHPASGLYYYGHRWYSPSLQRWLSKNPLGEKGAMNPFSVTDNNTVRFVHRWGLDSFPTRTSHSPSPLPLPPDKVPPVASNAGATGRGESAPSSPGTPPSISWPGRIFPDHPVSADANLTLLGPNCVGNAPPVHPAKPPRPCRSPGERINPRDSGTTVECPCSGTQPCTRYEECRPQSMGLNGELQYGWQTVDDCTCPEYRI